MIIAQISDIHAAPENDNLTRLECALAWLDSVKPDVLVITGDLTDNDWRDGYTKISACLNSRTYPKFILPGNSDNRRVMRSVLHNDLNADGEGDQAMHFVADMGEIRLIGLDATIPGASAASAGEHIPWLEKALSAKGNTASMLFMHHHVFPSGIPPLDDIMCGDAQKLGAFLRQNPQRPLAIATGHVHRPVAGTLAGIPAYICGSICPANPLWFGTVSVPPANDPPALMVHRFIDGSVVSHHVSL
ncbi:metallophosphoesterase [Rahnella woolbedingensis]|uniref:Metallophosphoesterase n=1 Tax=Rahnella woolbedingensis TaxID=1510574 RepID=A0A419N4A7_9GAMM|nr:metallophosphoesterase [Rahnella woolbedingensis]RJT39808.1 metallophosphoesterase [Rahnella woolbedingensis]